MIDVNATVHLTLPAGHCVTILQGLDELPHKQSRAVIDAVRQQIADQHPSAFEQPPAAMPQPLSNGHDARE
jgi:hypothetical protein